MSFSRDKVKTNQGTDILSGGLSECDFQIGIERIDGYKVGTTCILVQSWKEMSGSSGSKATEAKKMTGGTNGKRKK